MLGGSSPLPEKQDIKAVADAQIHDSGLWSSMQISMVGEIWQAWMTLTQMLPVFAREAENSS